jgi:PBSX family phage portal protein
MAKTTKVRVRTREQSNDKYRIFKFGAEPANEDAHVLALKEYSGHRQIEDPFKNEYGSVGGTHHVLEPVYNFHALIRLPDENSMLRQCIDAMITNVDGHGYQLSFVGPEGQEETSEALAEKSRIEELFDFPNDEYSLQELRDRLRRDFETLGNAYIEVGFDREGKVSMLAHIPAHTMRMTKREDRAVPVEVFLPRNGKRAKQVVRKRFRRFVQQVGVQKVYFKEYGDPRVIDPSTGFERDLPVEESATSIIHLSMYNPGSPYGLPRWFNQLPAIMGTRQAELTNLDFFKDNAIPAMAILVSGGTLTDDTLSVVENHFNAVRGRQSFNRLLVIEATGDEEAVGENGNIPPPRLELKPLVGERQGDGLFQEYEKNNRDKIRSAFRLPPLFVGLSEDMTYATAKTSYEVAESQVFAPERQRFDDMVNLKILSTFEARFWEFRSNPPRLSDPSDVMNAIGVFDKVGALTPNIAIQLANQFFDIDIKPVPQEEKWGDYPFEMIKQMVASGKLEIAGLSDQGAMAGLMSRLDALDRAVADQNRPEPTEPTEPVEPEPGDDLDPNLDPTQRSDQPVELVVIEALQDLRRVIKRSQEAA